MRAFVGLGGNLGDAAATLRAALAGARRAAAARACCAPRACIARRAWGRTDQPDFVNAVGDAGNRARRAQRCSTRLLAIERDFGRDRAGDGSDRWGPRTLDLDLLLYGDAAIDEPGLHVPHPHLHERAFVLVPLVEIAPDVVIPGHGRRRDALRGDGSTGGIEALD